jgi:hypothetical protein
LVLLGSYGQDKTIVYVLNLRVNLRLAWIARITRIVTGRRIVGTTGLKN